MKLAAAVRKSLAALDVAAGDQAAAELAVTYAKAVDDGGDLDELGPKLLATLESLHMTPRARAQTVKGGRDGAAGPLDELRQRRAARQRDTAAVDPAAT